MTGAKFGRWTVVGDSARTKSGRMVRCRCECGTEKTVHAGNLLAGRSRSCGCYARERTSEVKRLEVRHGHASKGMRTPTYRSWLAMKRRCLAPDHPYYDRYGGRGITICDRWMAFEDFLADMGERPPGMTLDRIDGEAGYEPSNCRWATTSEQIRNRCSTRLTECAAMQMRWLHGDGGHSMATIARVFDVAPSLVWSVVRGRSWL